MLNIEKTEERSPEDIDLVTFFYLPDGESQESLFSSAPNLFNSQITKKEYNIDSYFTYLNSDDPETLVKYATYWYSVWSHRRDGLWKGFLQVELSDKGDEVAMRNLTEMMKGGDTL